MTAKDTIRNLDSLVCRRVIVITGDPGSGKTETSVNLASFAAVRGYMATVIDLDVVTPLFRSRDARILSTENVRVIAPSAGLRGSDLPLVPGEISAAVDDPRSFTVIDCGGGPTGARAFGSIRRLLGTDDGYEALAVVNPYRPVSGAPAADSLSLLEDLGRFSVSGIISNPHLGAATTPAIIVEGHRRVEAIADRMGVPVRFLCAHAGFVPQLKDRIEIPMLGLRLFMVCPWDVQDGG